ncbi:MAG: thiamine phosphate synthase [Betaproteobacteria bacterium]|nr:thiamine phosphate synthase [Betaproteobacteria bacterium]
MRTTEGLYAVTPDGLATPHLLALAEAALAGGAPLLQYRDKSGEPSRRREQAQALLALCRRYGSHLIVNDDLALALAIDADGVHLGGDDGDLAVARRTLGPNKILGASCYADFARAKSAAQAGADYVAFGAIYTSPTKPLAQRASLELLARARRELAHVQVAAIGGITLDNVAPVIAAGAHFTAVITDLFEAPDVTARAAAYQRLFAESAAHELPRHQP